MISIETHSALLQYLSSLAKQHDSTLDTSFSGKIVTTGATAQTIVLPGPNNAEKAILERELAALSTRIQYLEVKANIASNHVFPITPAESYVTPLLHAPAWDPATCSGGPYGQVINWPPGCESDVDQSTMEVLTEEQLNYLRGHVVRQADRIENQHERIDNLNTDVNEPQEVAAHDISVTEINR